MRVLIWSNAPWINSGYGKQARYAARILESLGHQVAFAAYSGHQGSPIKWENKTVLPSGMLDFSVDVLVQHAQVFRPDLLILLGDLWKLEPIAADLARLPCIVAGFAIIDAAPLGPAYRRTLQLGAMEPVAVSTWGRYTLQTAGFENVAYLPHCFDEDIYHTATLDEKNAIREETGIPHDAFVIGLNAANQDLLRKGFGEQFQAFQRFSKRHAKARLMVFTIPDHPRGIPLVQIANDLGIASKTHWIGSYGQVAGMIDEQSMCRWYQNLDVLSMCSYGEGFGVPAIEANACGIPVVGTDCSALSELVQYPVRGYRRWNEVHRAWWYRPDESDIVRQWGRAMREGWSGMPSIAHHNRMYTIYQTARRWDEWLRTLKPKGDHRDE